MLGAVRVEGPDLDNAIASISTRHGVDPALTKAIMRTESHFDVNARRYEPHIKDSSLGLMQVLMKTAKWILGNPNLTESELLNPLTNIEAGVKYLKYQMGRYGGDIKKVMAAYNAGSVKRNKAGNIVNQSYIDKTYPHYLFYKASGIFTQPQAWIGVAIAGAIGLGILMYAYR